MSVTTAESPVTPHDLQVFGEEVLTAFLLEQGLPEAPQQGDDSRRVHASIAVTGGWSGHVTLDVSRTGADVLAARMLQADEVSDEDVVDAIGELVNVLGGNVKGLLLEESALGLPEVSTDAPGDRRTATEVCHAELLWAGHPVDVRVWLAEQDDTTPGDTP
ncbi:chemotaxis protein CheX [Nocardioides sp. BE266]|uniref:chemotaxis protein CheX n=1 Tax=Nocardioides sp. BE266 TaxID=2817725 RepID=UPI00285D8386|nr:chemotaxis protein CheX [Nocardioides sp. BE266]MDR7252862.1 chemotaxis protein CheX [Nocardioides sp. BE266]